MKTTHQDRLARYVVMAAVPAAASAGYAVADIIHYGGPAIEITRSNFSSTTTGSRRYSISYGIRSGFYGDESSTSNALLRVANFEIHGENTASAPDEFNLTVQAAKLAMFNNDSMSGVSFATTGNGDNLARRFEMTSTVGGDESEFFRADLVKLAATWSSSYVTSGGSGGSAGSEGEWRLDGEAERRFYAGFRATDTDSGHDGFGWMDIGWDGTTLTIYDWAFNTDGAIHVPDTHVVPGGAGLAALAMGAAGMRRRRKRSA